MTVPFQFAILRFSYDTLSEEFINVGVVVYSQKERYLRARVTSSYARASRFFVRIDGTRFRQTTRYIEDRIAAAGRFMETSLGLEGSQSLGVLLDRILPPDDSAFRFGSLKGGLSEDLDLTLTSLFDRYVDAYNKSNEDERRNEEEVWRTFREQLDKRAITSQLQPKKIVSTNYEYDFEHAWKNGMWNLYEPISFDLLDGSAMLEKANKWVGRAFALSNSPEQFKLTFLLGAPTSPKLQDAYVKAENLLNAIKVKHHFVREKDATEFARELEDQIKVAH